MVGPNPNIGGVGSSASTGPITNAPQTNNKNAKKKAPAKKDAFGQTATPERSTRISQAQHEYLKEKELQKFKEGIVTYFDPTTGESLELRPEELEAKKQDVQKRILDMLKLASGGDPVARKSLLKNFEGKLSEADLTKEISELEDLANSDLGSLSISELEQLRKIGGKSSTGIDSLIASRKSLVAVINRLDPSANVSETMEGSELSRIHEKLRAKSTDELLEIQGLNQEKKKAPLPEKAIPEIISVEVEKESEPRTIGFEGESGRAKEREGIRKKGTA